MTEQEKELLQALKEKERKELESNKKRKATKKRKGLFSKLILVVGFCYLVYFTERVLNVFEITSSEPVSLIAAVFAAVLGEFGLTAWVKNTKIKKGEKND